MSSSLMCEATDKSCESEDSKELSDLVDPSVSAGMVGNQLLAPPVVPPLPTRMRLTGRAEGRQYKARAPSPRNYDTSAADGGGATGNQSTRQPPVPPRVPLMTGQSSDPTGRPILEPRVAGVHSICRPVNSRTSASTNILRSRPPPPPRELIRNNALHSSTKGVTLMTSNQITVFSPVSESSQDHDHIWWSPSSEHRSNMVGAVPECNPVSSALDHDHIWWSSADQRSQPASQVFQLTHWPITALSVVPTTETVPVRSRKSNEYVDSPRLDTRSIHDDQTRPGTLTNIQTLQSSVPRHLWPVPPIPAIVPSTKANTDVPYKMESTTGCRESILCSRCGKCRCEQCAEKKALPRVWVKDQECSARILVDCCTCLCCARALIYHCRSSEENDWSDEPCSCCEKRDCCRRWTALGLLSLCLPCLCLYWPLEAAVRLCTSCYNRHQNQACRCKEEKKEPVTGTLKEGLLHD